MRKHCRNKKKKDTVASTGLKERKIKSEGRRKGGMDRWSKKWTRGGFSWVMVDNRKKQWDERTQQCASRKALAWYPAIDPRGEGWGYTSPYRLSALNTCDCTEDAWGHLKRLEFLTGSRVPKVVTEDILRFCSSPGSTVKWRGWWGHMKATTRLSMWRHLMSDVSLVS